MLCAPIKLSHRTLKPGERDVNKYRSKLLDEKLYMKSDYYHSYKFRFDRSKKFIGTLTNTNHSVAVNNIFLPENIPGFNTGSSMQKWCNKRPRLKSSNTKPYHRKEISPKMDPDLEENFDVIVLIQRFSKELEAEQNINDEDEELCEEEIDPDIQRLISMSQESSSEQDDNHKHKKRHKKKEKKENKEKKVKTIRFSLSKPPSPQTVQVIRVDVTSNYSWEEEVTNSGSKENTGDCSKGCGKRIRSGIEARKAMLKKQFSMHAEDGDEVDILCKKLTLMERDDEENKSLLG